MYIYIYEVSLLWMSPSQPNDMNCLSWGSLTLAVWLRHVVQWQEEANLMVTSKPQICVIKPHGFIFCSCMCPFRGRGDGDPRLSDAFPGKWAGLSARLPSKWEGAGRDRASAQCYLAHYTSARNTSHPAGTGVWAHLEKPPVCTSGMTSTPGTLL